MDGRSDRPFHFAQRFMTLENIQNFRTALAMLIDTLMDVLISIHLTST